jgi:hypothetical protein
LAQRSNRFLRRAAAKEGLPAVARSSGINVIGGMAAMNGI